MAVTSAPNRTTSWQLGEEGVRQPIHAADDLLHVDVGLADVLAQLFDDR